MKTHWSLAALIWTNISDHTTFLLFKLEWIINSTSKVTPNSQPHRCTFARHQLQFLCIILFGKLQKLSVHGKVKFEFRTRSWILTALQYEARIFYLKIKNLLIEYLLQDLPTLGLLYDHNSHKFLLKLVAHGIFC